MFLAQNSPLLFAKRTSNICSPKNQNPTSPNARIGINGRTDLNLIKSIENDKTEQVECDNQCYNDSNQYDNWNSVSRFVHWVVERFHAGW